MRDTADEITHQNKELYDPREELLNEEEEEDENVDIVCLVIG